jgi:hypothetical protein
MAQRRLFFIFSLLLPFLGISQEDTTSVKRVIIPSIYIDYGKLLLIPSDFETKYEGGIELLINEKFPIIVEVGSATLAPQSAYANGSYESSGSYYRVGAGVVSQIYPKNKLGISFRYGASTFDEKGSYSIESSSGKQDNYVGKIDRKNLSADWTEIVVYSDRDLNDLFTIGLNIRFRILNKYDSFDPIDVYSIPGYGRSFDKVIPALNLFFKVSF